MFLSTRDDVCAPLQLGLHRTILSFAAPHRFIPAHLPLLHKPL